MLSDAGLRVVVVDRRGAVRGSTAASTSLIQFELDKPLTKLAAIVGREKAERMWRRSRLAVDALRERSRQLDIRADLVNRDSLYLSGNVLDRSALRREAEARRRAGFNTTFLEKREVSERFGIRGRSALLSYDNFSADPRRHASGFLRAAIARGTRLYAPVEVSDVHATRRSVEAGTKDGPMIRCQALVFATGYEMPKAVRSKEHRIFSTWAIATRPQPRALWPTQCFIWEAADPYLYMRVSPDHRVICGGEDEKFSDEEARDALLIRQEGDHRAQAEGLVSTARHPRGVRLVRLVWLVHNGHADDRCDTRTSELLRRDGLWRQWHHVLDDGGADAARTHYWLGRPRYRLGIIAPLNPAA